MTTETDCAICHEALTAATGRTVLGCAHEFHLACITRWFYTQVGVTTSCPCCQRETGEFDSAFKPAAEEAPKDNEDEVVGDIDVLESHVETLETIATILLGAQFLEAIGGGGGGGGAGGGGSQRSRPSQATSSVL